MIRKENRLQGKRAVNKILSKGFSVKANHLSCRLLPGRACDKAKMTVVVGKKISNLATERNKLKRKVREAFDSEIRSKSGILMIVFPSKAALTLPFDKLQEEARECLKNLPSS